MKAAPRVEVALLDRGNLDVGEAVLERRIGSKKNVGDGKLLGGVGREAKRGRSADHDEGSSRWVRSRM